MHRKDDTKGFGGDGGPALEASFDEPTGITLGPDGALYIADTVNHRIRRVGLDEIVTTVAGMKVDDPSKGDFGGDGGPAAGAKLSFPTALAFGPDGSLYVYDGILRFDSTKLQHRIRRIAPALPGFSNQEIVLPSQDGKELYKFSAAGLHLETLSALNLKRIHHFEYDKNGRLLKVEDAYKNATTIERDADGHPLGLVAPNGQRTVLALDSGGYLAKVTNPAGEFVQMTYHSGGLLADFSIARGNVMRFTYDEIGRLTKDDDAAGGFTALVRTETTRGFEVALTTALKPATTYSVDQNAKGSEDRLEKCCCGSETKTDFASGRGYQVYHADGSMNAVTLQPDPRWGLQSSLLRSREVTTPGGLKYEMTMQRDTKLAQPKNPLSLQSLVDIYTVNGQKFTSTHDIVKQTMVHTSPAGRTKTTSFDDNERITKIEEPGILPVYIDYDDKGRLTTVRQGEGAEQRLLRLDYDADGNLSLITDPMKRIVRLEYNKAGRLIKQTLADKREIVFSFDPQGNLKSLTPPGKSAHVFEHTPLDQAAKYSPPDTGGGSRDTGYEFNKDRKLTKISRPDGKTIALAYSNVGQVETVTVPGQELRFTFDQKTEQLRSIASATGSLSFNYDGFLPTETKWDGPIKGTVNRKFDNGFRLTSISVNGGPPTTFKHDPDSFLIKAGELTLECDPKSGFLKGTKLGDVATAHEYTGFGERKKFAAAFGGKEIMAVDYERDSLGRIVKKTETIEGKTDVYAYEYDLVSRLKTASKNGKPIEQYTYDSNSNRIKYAGQRGNFTGAYDGQDRILSYGPITFKHNANGDLESKTEAGKTTAFDYDVFGNLRAVAMQDGTKIEYMVDNIGRRIGKKVGGKLVQGFLWQGQLKPIAELDGEGKVVSRFTYATGINVPDYMEKGGKAYRIITDHLGSARLIIEIATGQITQRLDYDEFGNVLADSNPGFQPFGFAGGIYDPQTKLVRFGYRNYDGLTGRWTTRDPIGFSGGQANLYAYARNNPVGRVDPSGLDVIYNGLEWWNDNLYGGFGLTEFGGSVGVGGATTIGFGGTSLTGGGIATAGGVYTVGLGLGTETTGVAAAGAVGAWVAGPMAAFGVGTGIGLGFNAAYEWASGQSMGEDLYDYFHQNEPGTRWYQDPPPFRYPRDLPPWCPPTSTR